MGVRSGPSQYDDPVCEVSYELKPVGGGVDVTLRVSQLPVASKTPKDMAGGGIMILNSLRAICDNGRLALGTRLIYWMFWHMEFVLPKRTRSEH